MAAEKQMEESTVREALAGTEDNQNQTDGAFPGLPDHHSTMMAPTRAEPRPIRPAIPVQDAMSSPRGQSNADQLLPGMLGNRPPSREESMESPDARPRGPQILGVTVVPGAQRNTTSEHPLRQQFQGFTGSAIQNHAINELLGPMHHQGYSSAPEPQAFSLAQEIQTRAALPQPIIQQAPHTSRSNFLVEQNNTPTFQRPYPQLSYVPRPGSEYYGIHSNAIGQPISTPQDVHNPAASNRGYADQIKGVGNGSPHHDASNHITHQQQQVTLEAPEQKQQSQQTKPKASAGKRRRRQSNLVEDASAREDPMDPRLVSSWPLERRKRLSTEVSSSDLTNQQSPDQSIDPASLPLSEEESDRLIYSLFGLERNGKVSEAAANREKDDWIYSSFWLN